MGAEGEQLGVKPLPEALAQARDQQFDLVEVAPNANPPVARIMDYGRYVYEQEQRRRQSKRKATKVVIKEMKFKPKIDEHDYVTKMKHVMRFLDEGNKVKLTIWLRGREIAHPELGMRILRRIAEDVGDQAIIESQPRQDGRNMTMVLHPTKKETKKEKPERTKKADSHKADAPVADARRGRGRGARAREGRSRGDRHHRGGGRRGRSPAGRQRSNVMPKMKTHRGAAKRFRVTGTGKVRRRKAYRSHLLEKKPSKRTRRLGRDAEVVGKEKKKVLKLLGR